MKFLIFAMFLAGCSAATEERFGTLSYSGSDGAAEPYLTEAHSLRLGSMGDSGVLWVHNPLPYPIQVRIACSSIFQADFNLHVRARSTRLVQATFPHDRITASCLITEFGAAP